jgi:sporulation protein YlmC with PRC-barrel domain
MKQSTMKKSTRFIPTNRLEQYDVVNQRGQDMGQVQNFVVDMVVGRIAFAIVSFEGFLGISDKWFAMPWDILTWSVADKKFILDMTKEALEKAPGMDKSKWPDEINFELIARSYHHFGVAPYWESTLFTEEQKRKLAYAIWEKEARPAGKDVEHYYRAENQLREQGKFVSQSGGDTKA